jgi:ribitol 2-dehydrogenase
MENNLEGKIAAVTGAASGIGLATSEALLKAGAMVVMIDRNRKALEELTDKLGRNAISKVSDLLDFKSCAAMIPEIIGTVGRIDILHCNAGTYIGGALTDTDEANIDRMLNLNINAVVKNVYAVLPHMKGRGTGDIIVTCSLAGHSAIAHEPVYSASKWAITCFVQTMRRQLNKYGIRVGQVSPGPVNSALLADWSKEMLRATIEAGAVIEPSEVAEAVMFMLTRPRNVTIRDVIVLPTNVDA